MKSAVGYVRVSTDDQHLGPEAQRTAISEWCDRHKYQLLDVHEDLGISGGRPIDERPGLLAAVAMLEPGQVLVVARRDRLARDVLVSAMVERLVTRLDARILSADGVGNEPGPAGQLFAHIVDAFSQYTRALIRSQTQGALAVKRFRGERVGSIPYGSRLSVDGIHLEKNPHELRMIDLAMSLRSDGLSFAQIADRLSDLGYKSRPQKKNHYHGGRIHPMTVYNIIKRRSDALGQSHKPSEQNRERHLRSLCSQG